MDKGWRVLKTDDNREFLAALHKVDSLESANAIAQKLLPIIAACDAQHEATISISSESISVILHGQSPEPINDKDWELANKLEPFLV